MENKNYQDTARRIVEIVGRDNIISATHCATRLRLIVKDKDVIDEKELEKVPFVKGTFFNAGQYQVILGTGIVNKVYAGIEQMNLKTLSKQEQDEIIKKQQKGVKRLMRTLGDIFVPIIPVIAATGLFLGLKGCLFNDNVLALFGANSSMIPNYIVTLVNVLTETAFAFLPAIICWSAFKVFGGTPVIGMVIGLMLVSPILPNALDLIMTPFIVMLATFLATILGIGPVMHIVELKLVQIVELLIGIPFGIGGFLIGATYPLLVITGLHHTYTMIETSLLANTGFNPVITLCAMYGFANVGTCLAFFAKAKKENVRQTAVGAMLSQLFGISEPVLFGIQIRYNLRPLVIMLCSSGLGAALLSVLNIQSNSYGLAVLPSYLMYIYEGRQLLWYFIVSLFSVTICFVLTYMFGIPQEVLEADRTASQAGNDADVMETEPQTREKTVSQPISVRINSPLAGKAVSMKEVPDDTFAAQVLGKGMAVLPDEGKVFAPCEAQVTTVFDTKHAIGLTTKDGVELLIHIGINTVELGGKYYEIHVAEGDQVQPGQLMATFDITEIQNAGYNMTTPVIVTNTDNYRLVEELAFGTVRFMDPLIRVEN